MGDENVPGLIGDGRLMLCGTYKISTATGDTNYVGTKTIML